tara:strand:+ start:2784 stop:2912 length:129 start_codon:yes stop_codon:yes gene_type:complete
MILIVANDITDEQLVKLKTLIANTFGWLHLFATKLWRQNEKI